MSLQQLAPSLRECPSIGQTHLHAEQQVSGTVKHVNETMTANLSDIIHEHVARCITRSQLVPIAAPADAIDRLFALANSHAQHGCLGC